MASTVDAKLLKATKFPPEFSQKVDFKKVNLEVMKKYAILLRVSSSYDILTSHQMDCGEDIEYIGHRR